MANFFRDNEDLRFYVERGIDWSELTNDVTAVFVNGTRILTEETIQKINKPIVNIHVGITPAYRGMHGGYWALYKNDKKHFGTTLHIVDKGIDTGLIIDQIVLQPNERDNFRTYPILQYIGGLSLLSQHIDSIKSGNIKCKDSLADKSMLYYHPTFGQYIRARINRGIR